MSKKSDIRVVTLANYNRPPVKENKVNNWVLNGVNNEFYQYIIDRNNGSPTNSSINNTYSTLIYGKGIDVHEGEGTQSMLDEFLKYASKEDQKAIIKDWQVFGEFSAQIHRQKGNKNKLAKIEHISKNKVVPSIENEFGKITSYWFSNDWSNRFKAKNKPQEFPAFGMGDGSTPEIYVGKPYIPGKEYFPDPEYFAGLVYADLEEEISNFYISHAKNGLSFGTVINIPNSADWDEDRKDAYEKKVRERTTTTSNAGHVIVSFNAYDTDPITIDNIENNTAHKQWDFLTQEARQQILTSHRVTSPVLVGVNTASGFSSTADEMDQAELQLMKRVIQPKQDFVIEAYEEILDYFNINITGLYYRPLTEIEGAKEEEEKIDEATTDDSLEMSASCGCKKKIEFESSELDKFIALGEIINPLEYDLIQEVEVDYEEEELLQLATTGVARPNSKSSQDGDDYIVRYKYTGNPVGEREFCNKMIQAGKVYRKEDIIQMGSRPVNPGFGMDGADTYSIWLYKGGGLLSKKFPGGTCKHKWNRVIYLKKGSTVDVNSPLAQTISTSEARRRGYKIETNDSLVSVAPHSVK